VADVEAFDAADRGLGAQELLQRGDAQLLVGLRRQALADRERCVLPRHVEPGARLADGPRHDLHRVPREAAQDRLHLGRDGELVGDDAPRDRLHRVVLLDEGLEHRRRIAARGVLREEAAVAQVPAAAHHGERHAPHRLALDHDDHVAVARAGGLDRLAREDALQHADLSRYSAAASYWSASARRSSAR
jgi:hypothetical protein